MRFIGAFHAVYQLAPGLFVCSCRPGRQRGQNIFASQDFWMQSEDSLDDMDRRILTVLATDGRISMTALGRRVGLSKTPVTARVKRLEASGVITGYRAELSARKLALEHVAFLEVRLSDTREQSLREFNRAVRMIPDVEACHMIAGGFDYLLKVRTKDINDYRRVLGEQISRLPHLASTSTYVSMESVLDTGALHV